MEELLSGVLRDIAAHPARFLAELLQGALLLGAIAWAGRRWAAKRLRERRAKIASALADAGQAELDAVRLRDEARALGEGMEKEGAEIVRAARERAERERDAAVAGAEIEAEQLIAQARQGVEQEKARVLREAADRLVRLTAEAARRYLDETLTESDRRALMQKAILASLETLEGKPLPVGAGAS